MVPNITIYIYASIPHVCFLNQLDGNVQQDSPNGVYSMQKQYKNSPLQRPLYGVRFGEVLYDFQMSMLTEIIC